MTLGNDEARSWGASVAAHALLLIIALFIYWDSKVPSPPEIEILLIEAARDAETPPEIRPAERVVKPVPPQPRLERSAQRSGTRRAAARRNNSAPASSATGARRSTSPARTNASGDRRAAMGPTGSAALPDRPRSSDPIELPGHEAAKAGLSNSDLPSATPSTSVSRESTVPGAGDRRERSATESAPSSSVPNSGELSSTPGASVKISWSGGAGRARITGRLPSYPQSEQREATVTARFTVSPEGTVSNILIVRKATPGFEQAVLSALRTWKFNPLRDAGAAAEQTATAVFSFKLR